MEVVEGVLKFGFLVLCRYADACGLNYGESQIRRY